MTRVVYVNGRYKNYIDAAIHVEDRGFQFGDAVYEVIEVRAGGLVDPTRHLARLQRSLAELKMQPPMAGAPMLHIVSQVVRRNRVSSGIVYIQVTRGAGPREFLFPSNDVPSTLVVLARSRDQKGPAAVAEKGISVVSMPDIRWRRCDIKTVMLLPACLAKNEAAARGAQEAWFFDQHGLVTEGASSNAWIVTDDGVLVTRPLGPELLAGVTRATVFDVARAEGLAILERAFTLTEALAAKEAFITSATNPVTPVVMIDQISIGDGKPGRLCRRLRSRFHQTAEISAV